MVFHNRQSSINHTWIFILFGLHCCLSLTAEVNSEEAFDFDLEAGNALECISSFVKLTKSPIVYKVSELKGELVNAIRGRLTVHQAIEKMIEGTSLVLDEEVVPGIWMIRRIDTTTVKDPKDLISIDKSSKPTTAKDIFELSPFVVESNDSMGYVATSSLAGTRIKANLKDIATFLQIATPEFLEDTQATDLPTLGPYLANLEANPSNPYDFRIRGMHTATVNRDYFLTNMTLDAYNVERITLNSGGNSFLFGLGDPAGIINAGLKKAYIGADQKTIQFRYSSHEARRTIGDFTQTLIKDRLAIRVIGLTEDHRNQWKRAYYKDHRFFVATTFRPFDNTLIRANFEKVRTDNRAELRYSMMDEYSGWIDAGTPVYNPSNSASIPDGLMPLSIDVYYPYVTFDSPSSKVPFVSTDISNLHGVQRTNLMAKTIGLYGADPIWPEQTILDEDVFDYKHESMNTGKGGYILENATIYSATIEHRFGPSLSLEFAFFEEKYENESLAYHPIWIFENYTGSYHVYIDANTHFPDGRPNPNFLRPYTELNSDIDRFEGRNTREFRFTSAYEIDLSEHTNLLKWLGKHDFTGLYSQNRLHQRDLSLNPAIHITEEMDQQIRSNFDLSGYHLVQSRTYLGDAVSLDDPTPRGLVPPRIEPKIPDVLQVSYFDDLSGKWNQYEIPTQKVVTNRSNNLRTIDTFVLGMHSFFWDDHFVSTIGYRKDRLDIDPGVISEEDSVDNLHDPSYWGTIKNGDETGYEETYTFGGVVNPFSWLRIHYNLSENFRANNLAAEEIINIMGEPIDLDSGVSRDYGFSLQLFEGKLDIKFNCFEVNRRNVNDSEIIDVGLFPILGWFEQNLLEDSVKESGRTNEWNPPPDGFWNAMNSPDSVSDVRSYTASGMEISAVYNPFPNWRILLNIGKQETVQSKRGVFTQEWLRLRLSNYEQFFDLRSPRPSIAGPTWGEWATYLLQPVAELLATEGRVSPLQRKWGCNLVTNYEFVDGPLRGLGIGGVFSWQDRPVLGYTWKTEEDPTLSFLSKMDTGSQKPIYGETQSNADVWIRYRREIMSGELEWSIQLNIKNLFNSNDPIAVVANPDGTPAAFSIPESRHVFITNTIYF